RTAVLDLKGGVIGYVKPRAGGVPSQVGHSQHRFGLGHMNVLETIVRLPAPPIPGQPVRHLRVRTLTIPYFAGQGIAMAHIGELCYELRTLLQPHQMARRDPFAKAAGTADIRGYEVPVHRKSRLQSVGAHGAGEDIGYDGAVAVHVARIAVT